MSFFCYCFLLSFWSDRLSGFQFIWLSHEFFFFATPLRCHTWAAIDPTPKNFYKFSEFVTSPGSRCYLSEFLLPFFIHFCHCLVIVSDMAGDGTAHLRVWVCASVSPCGRAWLGHNVTAVRMFNHLFIFRLARFSAGSLFVFFWQGFLIFISALPEYFDFILIAIILLIMFLLCAHIQTHTLTQTASTHSLVQLFMLVYDISQVYLGHIQGA